MLDIVQPDREDLRRRRHRRTQVLRTELRRVDPVRVRHGLASPRHELVPPLIDRLRVRPEPGLGRLLHIDRAGVGEQGQSAGQVAEAHSKLLIE